MRVCSILSCCNAAFKKAPEPQAGSRIFKSKSHALYVSSLLSSSAVIFCLAATVFLSSPVFTLFSGVNSSSLILSSSLFSSQSFPMVFSTSYTCLGIDCCHFPVFRCLTSHFATCLGIDFYRFPVFRCLTSYFATCRASIAAIFRFFDALPATSPPI